MNRLEKEDERKAIYVKYGYVCQNCGSSVFRKGTPQLAHLIAEGKEYRSIYGDEIIDHPLNRKPTCSLYCNDRMNIGGNPGKCKELVKEITEAMDGRC